MSTLHNILLDSQFERILSQRIVSLDGAHLLIDNERWLNFGSRDYLGLSHRGELKKNAMKHLLQYGVGLSGAQLQHGVTHSQLALENKLLDLFHVEAVLLTASIEQATMAVLHTLTDSSSVIFIPENSSIPIPDKWMPSCHYVFYQMLRLPELLERIKDLPAFSKIIAAPFAQAFKQELISLAEHYQALIMVDVSEVLGITNLPNGTSPSHLILGDFSHALGNHGACIATSQRIKDYCLTHALLDYTLPAATIGSIETALELSSQMEGERRQLEQRAFWVGRKATELGLTTLPSPPHFVRCALDDTSALHHFLHAHRVTAHFDPGHVTFILNVDHTIEDLNQLVALLQTWSKDSDRSLEVAMQSATETPKR
jgi:8-amino-7-oxononanoate synthase